MKICSKNLKQLDFQKELYSGFESKLSDFEKISCEKIDLCEPYARSSRINFTFISR